MKIKKLLVVGVTAVCLWILIGFPRKVYHDKYVTVWEVASPLHDMTHLSAPRFLKVQNGGWFKHPEGAAPYYGLSPDERFVFFSTQPHDSGRLLHCFATTHPDEIHDIDLHGYSFGSCLQVPKINTYPFYDEIVSTENGEFILKSVREETEVIYRVRQDKWILLSVKVYKNGVLDRSDPQ